MDCARPSVDTSRGMPIARGLAFDSGRPKPPTTCRFTCSVRIVQEALANVHCHASASHVSIDLRWIADQLHVIVTDNGRGVEGIQEGLSFCPGNGIYGIRARARQFGGDLKIRSGPLGTKVHVVTPVERDRFCEASKSARAAC
jgi:signal transduction histidine kinase